MSYGSILLMCLLCFVLSGQERLPWAPAPDQATYQDMGMIAFARTDAFAAGAAEADVASSERLAPMSSAGASASTRVSAFDHRFENAPPLERKREDRCSAGVPLRLPASIERAAVAWMSSASLAATLQFELPGGGQLTFIQKMPASAGAKVVAPGHGYARPNAGPPPAQANVHVVWKYAGQAKEICACGVPEGELYAWMR